MAQNVILTGTGVRVTLCPYPGNSSKTYELEEEMGKRKERDGIVLLNEHMLFAEEVLTKEERAELYDAVRAYSMEDVEPDMSFVRPEWRGIFRIMRKAQDKVIKRYDEACERNRIRVNKRWHGQMPAHTEDTEDTENTGYTGNT